MEFLNKFLDFQLISFGEYSIKTYSLVVVLLIIGITKIVLWLIRKTLFHKNKFAQLDKGSVYAIYKILQYLIWVIALAFLLETIGVKVTVLIAGSAALLVGIGLGLQQTFNDFISGIILLAERSIRVGDILEIDGDVIKIQEIGLRTSSGLNRDDISIIVPNSLITTNKVINWSHQSKKTRFKVDVGVAYGSDIDLVLKILEEAVLEHPDVNHSETVEGRLINFGNSSLDCQVLFFSENVFRIGKAKSQIRRIIYKKLQENNISIPFPQVDVHLKNQD